jgi:uncharacterized membrane protein YphA (DoxX/SURF4 family)
MGLATKFRDLPGRIVTGSYIAHAGLDKWNADEDRAVAVHSMAAAAFPVLQGIPPTRFIRLLAAGEIATGAALLVPVVPTRIAGVALTAFSGALVAMYARTPAMHKPGSVWPTPAGTAVSKDVWLLAIGLGFLADTLTTRHSRRRVAKA